MAAQWFEVHSDITADVFRQRDHFKAPAAFHACMGLRGLMPAEAMSSGLFSDFDGPISARQRAEIYATFAAAISLLLSRLTQYSNRPSAAVRALLDARFCHYILPPLLRFSRIAGMI